MDAEYFYEEFWKIIFEHIAKLQSTNGKILQKILHTIMNKKEFKDYLDPYKKELSLANNTKINNSQVTFYNILVDDQKKLESYLTENPDLFKDFKCS